MFSEVDERFGLIKNIFEKTNASTLLIEKAYKTAKFLHKDQKRKDGLPYISHPVEVALILAELGFDEDVVSAGILHDVVEDCEYTLDDVSLNFNDEVAELVDCVSAIDKTKYIFNEESLFENEDFVKASIEEQSFQKLIAIGKKNPKGFCIKFADRLHNLRTIASFTYYKQLEKVRETEKWILPIAKILNAGYFYNEIRNECFKIEHKFKVQNFLEQYETYHNVCEKFMADLTTILKESFANYNMEVKIDHIKEYKVYEDLTTLNKNINFLNISQGQILRVANYNCYLLYKDSDLKSVISQTVLIFNKKLQHILKIIDVNIDKITNKIYLELEDNIKNKYNVYILTPNEYLTQRVGTTDGQTAELIDEENPSNLGADFIKVKTRSGEIKYVQHGSTVLDFAFKIHKDIGFGYKNAIINNSKTNFPPYTKLNDGDQVEILVDRNSDGVIINNAQLKWLAYVNSDLSKKILIKYFQKMLDNIKKS